MIHTEQRERVALASSFLALAVIALAVSCLGIAAGMLSGCGSTAGLFRPAGSWDYLYQQGAAFGVWSPEVTEITYSIDPNDSSLSDPEKAVQAGINDWGPTLSPRLTFRRVGLGETAMVRFHWDKHGALNGGSGFDRLLPDLLGVTQVHFGPRRFTVVPATGAYPPIKAQEIASADVWIDRGIPPYSFRPCAGHEFGHCLGVLFEDDRAGDLMYEDFPLLVYGPRARDKNTIRALYGLH